MNFMFQACVQVTELDVSGFDIGNVIDLENMFYLSPHLKKLDAITKKSNPKETWDKYFSKKKWKFNKRIFGL